MTMTKMSQDDVVALVGRVARACKAGTGHPINPNGSLAGHIALHGTPSTHTSAAGMLKALAVLGLSRSPWRQHDGFKRADLLDIDGASRGHVIVTKDGACATIWNGISNPPACFAA